MANDDISVSSSSDSSASNEGGKTAKKVVDQARGEKKQTKDQQPATSKTKITQSRRLERREKKLQKEQQQASAKGRADKKTQKAVSKAAK